MKTTSGIFALIIGVMLLNSCKKDKNDFPSVTTADVTEISYKTATSGGNVH